MTGPLLVGLDMGSTSVKAVAYAPDGQAVARASTPAATHYPRPSWAHDDPAELWHQAVTVLRQVSAQIDDPRRIAGIAVASVGEAGVPLDARGDPTYHAIAWFDRRTLAESAWLAREIGEDALFARTGLALQPIFTLCKLLWIRNHEPAAWSRTASWLQIADYIAYRLSGAKATDHSLASRTLMFNVHDRAWDDQILEQAAIPGGLLAPTMASGTRIGAVTPEAARQTGLPETAVVSTGGHDHVCGALAAGVIAPGTVFDSIGTAEAIFIALDQPITDPDLGRRGYTQGAHVVPDRSYALCGLYTSGACVEWFRDLVGRDPALQSLLTEAAAVPVGCLGATFLPHLRLANAPHCDPMARGAFVGLTTDTGRATLTRALLEGLAFEARTTLEPLLAYAGIDRPADVTVIGGGAKNNLLLQIKASILNARIQVVEREEATALGAAILAGLGAGVYSDIPTALEAVRSTPRPIAPIPADVPRYDAIYQQIYRPLYDTLRDLNHRIHTLHIDPADDRLETES